jgi:hypothetical protein
VTAAAELLAMLRGRGFTLAAEGHHIRVAPASRLTAELRDAIRANRAELLATLRTELLAAFDPPAAVVPAVPCGGTTGQGEFTRPLDAPAAPATDALTAVSPDAAAAPQDLPTIYTGPLLANEWPCYYWPAHRRWRSIHGVVLCRICVPPAHPSVVAEWLDADTGAPAPQQVIARPRGNTPTMLDLCTSIPILEWQTSIKASMAKLLKAIRQAIQASGMSRYAIHKATGIDQGQLSKLMKRQAGLSLESLETLADFLGLEIIIRAKRQKG